MPKFELMMDMRPALDGLYGIPQEIRLPFSAQAAWPDLQVPGLLQMFTRRVERHPFWA